MVEKTAISTDAAPKSFARYSQAVRKGNVLTLAGQVGFDPARGELAGPDIEAQTRQTLANLSAVLQAADASWTDVLMVRVYLTQADHFEAVNKIYEEFVVAPYPARTTVFVGLGPGMLVEMDALAVLDN
jgi:2-iminobutanoate/2-iminopropanoate deaminase